MEVGKNISFQDLEKDYDAILIATGVYKARQLDIDANGYKYDREAAYPALAEQFDKLFHDINNGTLDETGEFFTALKTVKDDNPKPSE